ncbi:MAG: hypothetical protein V4613_03355 [Bacteroidota bacterium]
MLKELIRHPAFIFRFAIYLLFVSFAVIFYFSNLMTDEDKTTKNIYSGLLFVYGIYRLIRSYQEFKALLREEAKNQE